MKLATPESGPSNLYDEMIERTIGQISEWKRKLDVIADRLKGELEPEFHELQDFVMDRLMSYGCAKHQGYVMHGFELDSEMASYLFLEPGDDRLEFNELTKPDYVIIMNRLMDQYDTCLDGNGNSPEDSVASGEDNEMKERLQKY